MNLSLIIPVYNEQDNLPMLFDALYGTMNSLGKTWEVIFVDDGSRDNSLSVLQEYAQKDTDHVRVISFRRNFGPQSQSKVNAGSTRLRLPAFLPLMIIEFWLARAPYRRLVPAFAILLCEMHRKVSLPPDSNSWQCIGHGNRAG